MAKRALTIGLNYTGTRYELPDCHLDAQAITGRAKALGYSVEQHTGIFSADEFAVEIERLRLSAKKHDTTLIQMSSHGTQWDEGGESDRMEEGLCFFNGSNIEVIQDDDFREMVESIPGVVIVFLDACFSGGMTRTLKGSVKLTGEWRGKTIPFDDSFVVRRIGRSLQRAVSGAQKTYYLLACEESEVSWSTGTGGLFTKEFCKAYDKAWREGRSISKLMTAAKKECLPDQTPKFEIFGGSPRKLVF